MSFAMSIDLRARGVELAPALREGVARRLRLGLARFGGAIRRIFITVADQNGPRGGLDKLCRLRLVTVAGPVIVIHEVDSVAERAVDAAADRAAQSMARQLARGRRGRRARQPNSAVRAPLRIATTAG